MIEPDDILIRYGLPGHEREYVVMVKGYGIDNYIPRSISDAVAETMRECFVMNRGSRIEVMTDSPSLEMSHDIRTAILTVFHRRPWL